MGNGISTQNSLFGGEVFARWIAILVVGVGVLFGFRDLMNTAEHNSRAIEAHTVALERFAELFVSEARQDSNIDHLEAEVNEIKREMREHINGPGH